MKYFIQSLLILSTILFTACSNTQTIVEISDLKNLSQKPNDYTKNIPTLNSELQLSLDEKFNEMFFKPWDLESMSYTAKEASWGNMYAKKEIYGENHKLLSKKWFEQQIDNSNFYEYNTNQRYAITTNNTNMRVFPTKSAMFYDPNKAGEGFPFDYNQNSALKLNTPLFISHYSSDRAWVFVESNFALGWVSIKDIAFVDDVLITKFKSGTYYVATSDNFPMYKNNTFIDYVKLGTIFPLRKNKFVTINKHSNSEGYLSYVKIKETFIAKKPLLFDTSNINKISNSIIEEPYGWGGLMNHRDCSSFTRDFFAPFGIYLKRNSYGQTQRGTYIELKDLSGEEKKREIVKNGVPFLTLIYLRGHIMLYIGEKNGEPLVFHNVWGVKTLEKDGSYGRFIIGRAVITTLEPGLELPNFVKDKNILSRVEGIVLLEK